MNIIFFFCLLIVLSINFADASTIWGFFTDSSTTICEKLKNIVLAKPVNTSPYDTAITNADETISYPVLMSACEEYSQRLFNKENNNDKCIRHVAPLLVEYYATETIVPKSAANWNCLEKNLNIHFDQNYRIDTSKASSLISGVSRYVPDGKGEVIVRDTTEKEVQPVVIEANPASLNDITTKNPAPLGAKFVPAAPWSVGNEIELPKSKVVLMKMKLDSNEYTHSDLEPQDYSQILYETEYKFAGLDGRSVSLFSITLDHLEKVYFIEFTDPEGNTLSEKSQNIFDVFVGSEEKKFVQDSKGEGAYRETTLAEVNQMLNIRGEGSVNEVEIVSSSYIGTAASLNDENGSFDEDGAGEFRGIEIINGPVPYKSNEGPDLRKAYKANQIFLSILSQYKDDSNINCDQTLSYFYKDATNSNIDIVKERKIKMVLFKTIVDEYNGKIDKDIELKDYFKLLPKEPIYSSNIGTEKVPVYYDFTDTHQYALQCGTWKFDASYMNLQVSYGLPISSYATGGAVSLITKKPPAIAIFNYAKDVSLNLVYSQLIGAESLTAKQKEVITSLQMNEKEELAGFFALTLLIVYTDALLYYDHYSENCKTEIPAEFKNPNENPGLLKGRLDQLPKMDMKNVANLMYDHNIASLKVISEVYIANKELFLSALVNVAKLDSVISAMVYRWAKPKLKGGNDESKGCFKDTFKALTQNYLEILLIEENSRSSKKGIAAVAKVIYPMLQTISATSFSVHVVVESRDNTSLFNKMFLPIPHPSTDADQTAFAKMLSPAPKCWTNVQATIGDDRQLSKLAEQKKLPYCCFANCEPTNPEHYHVVPKINIILENRVSKDGLNVSPDGAVDPPPLGLDPSIDMGKCQNECALVSTSRSCQELAKVSDTTIKYCALGGIYSDGIFQFNAAMLQMLLAWKGLGRDGIAFLPFLPEVPIVVPNAPNNAIFSEVKVKIRKSINEHAEDHFHDSSKTIEDNNNHVFRGNKADHRRNVHGKKKQVLASNHKEIFF